MTMSTKEKALQWAVENVKEWSCPDGSSNHCLWVEKDGSGQFSYMFLNDGEYPIGGDWFSIDYFDWCEGLSNLNKHPLQINTGDYIKLDGLTDGQARLAHAEFCRASTEDQDSEFKGDAFLKYSAMVLQAHGPKRSLINFFHWDGEPHYAFTGREITIEEIEAEKAAKVQDAVDDMTQEGIAKAEEKFGDQMVYQSPEGSEWDGTGLPPVGCKVELAGKFPGYTGHKHAGSEVVILGYVTAPNGAECAVYCSENCNNDAISGIAIDRAFIPIKAPEQKAVDLIAAIISHARCNGLEPDDTARNVLVRIQEGKIPHIKFTEEA